MAVVCGTRFLHSICSALTVDNVTPCHWSKCAFCTNEAAISIDSNIPFARYLPRINQYSSENCSMYGKDKWISHWATKGHTLDYFPLLFTWGPGRFRRFAFLAFWPEILGNLREISSQVRVICVVSNLRVWMWYRYNGLRLTVDVCYHASMQYWSNFT